MLGKYFAWLVAAAIVVIIGMLVYPTIHLNVSGIDVTGFIPLTQAGMIILSYGFIFFIVYIVWAHIRK